MATPDFLPVESFEQLSIRDLLEARDLYHVYLMQHPMVVATAVGRYRIRHTDSWPNQRGQGKKHGKDLRTLENSEIRPYSWPAILVFVEQWIPANEFSTTGRYGPDAIVPKALFLPDGRRVPVCVIETSREPKTPATPAVRFPLNNIGGGYPVIVDVQGQRHVATVACLVNDGHKVYGLTNRHVVGEEGEEVFSRLDGKLERIGTSAYKQLTRMPFSDVYQGWPGRDVYVNLDVGLIDIDNLDRWTARMADGLQIGRMADLSVNNISLALIGAHVRGYGAASSLMEGEIHALFYRYKSQAGSEYVADFFIGPRVTAARKRGDRSFATHPGDSGTLWLVEHEMKAPGKAAGKPQMEFLPIAMQWGENLLSSGGSAEPQSYALATCLSTVCGLLGVDPVRDWNLDQPDTWGAVGHFSIAARAHGALSARVPKLSRLMEDNLTIISHDDQTILESPFKGMGSDAFVPMADVPDFFWKHGTQGHSRGLEGPNHFADMDQPRQGDGVDLLTLCQQTVNIDPNVWNAFYSSVSDPLTGDPIEQKHRGLLPFRVWQIFDEMVRFAAAADVPPFVCAAGTLAHYVADACQPLHISYLHDGDPLQPKQRTVHHRDGTTEVVKEPLGKGVHAAYEDDMVNANRKAILDGLEATPKVKAAEAIANGFEAAVALVALMRRTYKRLPPGTIVDLYVQQGVGNADRTALFWKKFGTKTINCMKDGTHLLAVLWESAWLAGNGEKVAQSKVRALKEAEAMSICADPKFLPSLSIDRIGAKLQRPA